MDFNLSREHQLIRKIMAEFTEKEVKPIAAETDGTCWPSVRRIAADLKLSRRTVQRALSDLEHHGFLERTHRRRPNGSLTSNLYRVK
ncbi:MAG: helix-turn-helix domain-containing protein [Firmicutes bacterium]|nr:helix-turn-helix domain-containing protein [Bacillota bacterium]